MTVGEQPRNGVERMAGGRLEELPLDEKDLLRVMLDAMPVIAFAFDADGVLVYRAGGGAVIDEQDVVGRPVTEVWPQLRDEVQSALAGKTIRFDFAANDRVFDITYLPLTTERGHQAGVVGLSWDVTDQRRQNSLARRRAEALMTLSDRENSAGMEIDTVLESIAQTAAEQLGTWAYTTLLSADNRSFEVAGGWHPDPGVRQAIRGVYGRGVPADVPAFAAVLQNARALTVDAANQNNAVMQSLVLPALQEYLQTRPAIGIAHAPLTSRGRVIGVLSVHRSTGHPSGAFTEDDLALLDDFGQRAGLHVQVLMMFRRRVEAEVRALQQAQRQSALADLARIAMGPASLHDVVESAADAISANLGNIPVTVVALDPDLGPTPRADRGAPQAETAPGGVTAAEADEDHLEIPSLRRQIEGADGPWGVLTVRGAHVNDADVVAFIDTACSLLGTAVLQRMTTAQLQYQALHDALTSLPNRALLQDRLQGALGRCGPGDEVVLLMMDLDRFKTVNDSAGHVVGDHLLQEVARRLRAAFPEHTVGRLGGDEFALVAEIRDDPDGAHRLASAVADAFREPFALPGGHELFVSAAIGMSVARYIHTGRLGATDASGDSKDVTGMLREADAAMYSAKRGGGYRLFDERLRRAAHEKLDTETALRRAVAGQNFQLVYQPVVRAVDGRPVGVEALLRWPRDGRIVPPGDFIPTAEETGLILEIGRWVLRQAITDMAQWDQGSNHPCETLSVNVSMSELQSETYADDVLDLLTDVGLAAERLVIEVTESMLADNLLISHRNLRRLRNAGVHVAIDDFGTGYSSLGQLTELPVDVLKIDRTFVARMDAPGSRAIVTAVVMLGQALGLTITAEGVERADQAKQLTALGCDLLQGFHFGAGINAAQIAAMTFSDFHHRVPPD